MQHIPQSVATVSFLLFLAIASAQQNCYFGPGAGFRGPADLQPCNNTGISTCCLLGDTCLSGNACYNYASGNTYQYGCNDINYQDESCPKKCGWDPAMSPWIGLDYCSDIRDLEDTWTCLAPESCGCEWNSSYALQILPPRVCGAMGSEARVALYAPSTLLAYVSLPSTYGGQTAYYSTTIGTDGSLTVISTAIAGYTPTSFTQFTTYRELPASPVYINPGATASPATESAAYIYTATTPQAAASAAPTSSPPASSVASSTTPSVNTASTTSTPATVGPTIAPAATSASQTNSNSGLSTGAKAGIGAGVAGLVCLLAAIGLCWFLAVRRRRKFPTAEIQQPPQYSHSPPMGPYMQGPQPSGWAPFPAPGMPMPYYMMPVQQKDGVAVTASPPISPPRSPPPPASPPATELSSEERRSDRGGYEVYG